MLLVNKKLRIVTEEIPFQLFEAYFYALVIKSKVMGEKKLWKMQMSA